MADKAEHSALIEHDFEHECLRDVCRPRPNGWHVIVGESAIATPPARKQANAAASIHLVGSPIARTICVSMMWW